MIKPPCNFMSVKQWICWLYQQLIIVEETEPVLKGVQVALDFSGQETIEDLTPISFDTIVNSDSSHISYVGPYFEIDKPGNYYVSWWAATSGSEESPFIQFGITKNEDTSIEDAVLACSPVAEGQISGTAFITIEPTDLINAGDTARVYIRNLSGQTILFAPTVIKAMATIIEVDKSTILL